MREFPVVGERTPVMLAALMLLNGTEAGFLCLCKNRSDAAGSIRTDHLAGKRGAESQLLCNLIDAAGVTELRFVEAKLAVLFAKLLDLLLLCLDLVADLDRREVLPDVNHCEREEQRHHHGERPHLALTFRV